ncbi:MAG: hypothetical protein HS116_25160 [Planctomycetes bacterium]|nr:hypothetical protein [Planctomycetota bacterium]
METIKALIESIDDKRFIKIVLVSDEIRIPLTEDQPNEIKKAFNKLIARIREGEFKIEIEAVGEDLFSQVASEYINQLNREIRDVFIEMKDYGLIQDSDSAMDGAGGKRKQK